MIRNSLGRWTGYGFCATHIRVVLRTPKFLWSRTAKARRVNGNGEDPNSVRVIFMPIGVECVRLKIPNSPKTADASSRAKGLKMVSISINWLPATPPSWRSEKLAPPGVVIATQFYASYAAPSNCIDSVLLKIHIFFLSVCQSRNSTRYFK